MSDWIDRVGAALRGSQLLRLFSLLLFVLVLQIPVSMIGELVGERQGRRDTATADVSARWGQAQTLTGPALVVPYAVHRETPGVAGAIQESTEIREAVFLPDQLRLRGDLHAEARSLGIFSVPVYNLDLVTEGVFTRPDFAALGVAPGDVLWQRARLALGISDSRAIQEGSTLQWNGAGTDFLPGSEGIPGATAGIHADLALADSDTNFTFSFPLRMNGSRELFLTPFGRQTEVELASNHADPGFQGNWLPVERTVSDTGFTARWSIPYLGRNYPQAWLTGQAPADAVVASRFGVRFISPVDHYRMAERSVKYAPLFILLTFATIWLFEVLAGLRIHAIQYLLLGSALCLFYLLELSLAEHLGFPLAYGLAAAAVVGMVAAYGYAMLHRASRALALAAGVGLLYGYLYVLLGNEDVALVLGSLGLFLVLAGIMYATRKVDWYSIGARPGTRRDAQ